MRDVVQLIQQWVDSWVHVRGLAVSEVDGWPLVHVKSRTRESELICWDLGPDEFSELMRHIDGDPRAMLTVIAHDCSPYDALSMPPGVRVDRDDESFMMTELVDQPARPIDPAFSVRWDVNDHHTRYMVEAGEHIAAEGTAGVLNTVATFEAVETTRNYRRQGLGRHVMANLTHQAIAAGATSGLLVATPKGRGLYESLGWTALSPMRSFMGQAD